MTLAKLQAQLGRTLVAPWHPPRLGWLTSQAYLLLAEIRKYAIGHEMSNQQWWLPATSQLHLFCTTQSLFRTSFSTLLVAAPLLLQRSVHWPNDKHRLQEELWHLAFTTSTVAPLQVARLGWFLRQAHLPLHGGLRRTRKISR